MAAQAGVPQLAVSSLKAALDRDWDDPVARDVALARVLGLVDQVEAFVAGQAGDQAAAEAVAVARQVRDQDVDLAGPAPSLRRRVARDRRVSVKDGQMRHGRKSRSVRFDGYTLSRFAHETRHESGSRSGSGPSASRCRWAA